MSPSWPIHPCQSLRHRPLASTRTTAPPAGGARASGTYHRSGPRTRHRSGLARPACHPASTRPAPPRGARSRLGHARQSAGRHGSVVSTTMGAWRMGALPPGAGDTDPEPTRPTRLAPVPVPSGNPAPAREPGGLPPSRTSPGPRASVAARRHGCSTAPRRSRRPRGPRSGEPSTARLRSQPGGPLTRDATHRHRRTRRIGARRPGVRGPLLRRDTPRHRRAARGVAVPAAADDDRDIARP